MSTSAHAKKFKFWHDVLPHVTKRGKIRVDREYGGQTVGVDAQALLWEFGPNMDEVVRAIGHRLSYYEPTKMMRCIERIHENLLKQDVNPIYVFGGQRNPVIRPFLGADLAYDQMYRFHMTHGIAALEPSHPKLRELSLAAQQIRKLRDVDPKLPRFLANWMQSLGMEVIGAPFEPHWQLVELERQGRTAATMSSHMNVVVAGGERIMVNPNYRENMKGSKYSRKSDLTNHNWTYDFTGYVDYFPEFAAMTGTMYNFRYSGWSTKFIYRKRFVELVECMRNGEDYWAQQEKVSAEFVIEFHQARHHFRYGPVWRVKDGIYTIEPLNPLPEGSTWSELLGYDPKEQLAVDPADYERAAKFDGRSFVDEETMNIWYVGIFPKMKADQIDDTEIKDEEFFDFVDRHDPKQWQKEKPRVTKPFRSVREPEIGW